MNILKPGAANIYRKLNEVKQHIKIKIILKIAVFWDSSPCSLVDTDKCFRGVYCIPHQGDLPS